MKYLLIIAMSILVACKTSEMSKKANNVPSKVSWLNEPSFNIACEVAYPFVSNELNAIANTNLLGAGNTANRINLMGRGDYLAITDNHVSAALSYYGVQQLATANRSNSGIVMDGPIQDYSVNVNEKRNFTEISFSTRYNTENYDVNIRVYPSGNTLIHINSAKRNPMKYDGLIKELQEE